MPRLKPYDGGHTAFHDHRIRIGSELPSGIRSNGLRAWRQPAESFRQRNLGLAYISAGSKAGSDELMRKGFGLLRSNPSDGAVETARGMMLLRLNKAAAAVEAFRHACEEQPANSLRRYNLAVALLAIGDRTGAMQNVEQAIALEPLLEDAYALAAEIEPARASEWKRRYLRLAPQRFLR
jgi:predicted Zn-dependent protease